MKKIVLVLMLSSIVCSFGMDGREEIGGRPVKVQNNKHILKSSVEDTNLYKRIVALSPVALSPHEAEREQPFYVRIAPQIFFGLFPEN